MVFVGIRLLRLLTTVNEAPSQYIEIRTQYFV